MANFRARDGPGQNTPNAAYAVAVCGPIGAGKTTVLRALAARYRWDIVSFGDYVRGVADAQGLAAGRSTWQELGARLLADLGPAELVHRVLAAAAPSSAVHLYDGVRHIAVVAELDRRYDHLVVVYIDLPVTHRYARWVTRQRAGDPDASPEGFRRISEQQIERGVAAIRSVADAIIDGRAPMPRLLDHLERLVTERGYPLEGPPGSTKAHL